MRLIDADAICKECVEELLVATCENCVIKDHKINKSIDAVPVVRCKDCKYHHYICPACFLDRKEDDFCSYGERKEG